MKNHSMLSKRPLTAYLVSYASQLVRTDLRSRSHCCRHSSSRLHFFPSRHEHTDTYLPAQQHTDRSGVLISCGFRHLVIIVHVTSWYLDAFCRGKGTARFQSLLLCFKRQTIYEISLLVNNHSKRVDLKMLHSSLINLPISILRPQPSVLLRSFIHNYPYTYTYRSLIPSSIRLLVLYVPERNFFPDNIYYTRAVMPSIFQWYDQNVTNSRKGV
jgi:hypothetical protein